MAIPDYQSIMLPLLIFAAATLLGGVFPLMLRLVDRFDLPDGM